MGDEFEKNKEILDGMSRKYMEENQVVRVRQECSVCFAEKGFCHCDNEFIERISAVEKKK